MFLPMLFDNAFMFLLELEHVQFNVSIDHRRRGDLVIDLISPSGTTSRLLAKRPGDDGTRLAYWPFMTVEFWDENPRGEWTVKIRDEKVIKWYIFG